MLRFASAGSDTEAIADSSSLIALGRLNALWLPERILEPVVIVPGVDEEVAVQGRVRDYKDRERIEIAIRASKLVAVASTAQKSKWQHPWLGASRPEAVLTV